MVTSEKSNVGRPRSFDEEAVLDDLTALFWSQGYSQTSMADIVETSNVHKPTLYRTFGTKDELFATVLRRYLQAKVSSFAELIEQAGPGISGIHTFLDLFEADAINGTGKDGCLMVMASNELRGTTPGYEDFAADYRAALTEQIGKLVERAHPGDPGAEVIATRTDLLATFLLGINVTIRSGASATELHRYINAMRATIDAW